MQYRRSEVLSSEARVKASQALANLGGARHVGAVTAAKRGPVSLSVPCGSALFHEPTVTDHQGLARQRVGPGAGEIKHGLGDLLLGRELPVDGPLQHHVPDDVGFADAEFLGLLGNLSFDQWRSYETPAYYA